MPAASPARIHRRNGLVAFMLSRQTPGRQRRQRISDPYLVHVRSSLLCQIGGSRRFFRLIISHPSTGAGFPGDSTPGDVWFHIAPSSALVGMDRIPAVVASWWIERSRHLILQRHGAVLRPLAAGEVTEVIRVSVLRTGNSISLRPVNVWTTQYDFLLHFKAPFLRCPSPAGGARKDLTPDPYPSAPVNSFSQKRLCFFRFSFIFHLIYRLKSAPQPSIFRYKIC